MTVRLQAHLKTVNSLFTKHSFRTRAEVSHALAVDAIAKTMKGVFRKWRYVALRYVGPAALNPSSAKEEYTWLDNFSTTPECGA